MSESWKCQKCGHINTGTVGGVMFGGSFSSDMAGLMNAAKRAQNICALCGAERASGSRQHQKVPLASTVPVKSISPNATMPKKPYVPGMGAAIIVVVLSILGPFLLCVPYLVAIPLCIFIVVKAEKRSAKIVAIIAGVVISIVIIGAVALVASNMHF